MLNQPKRRLLILVIICLSIFFDQATKHLAYQYLHSKGNISLLADTVRFRLTENTGAFLSLGSKLPEGLRFYMFSVVVSIFMVILLFFLFRVKHLPRINVFAFSFIAGGGLSNLIDRLLNDGAVIDFLNVGIASLRTGIFNLADLLIMVGIFLLVLNNVFKVGEARPAELSTDQNQAPGS